MFLTREIGSTGLTSFEGAVAARKTYAAVYFHETCLCIVSGRWHEWVVSQLRHQIQNVLIVLVFKGDKGPVLFDSDVKEVTVRTDVAELVKESIGSWLQLRLRSCSGSPVILLCESPQRQTD